MIKLAILIFVLLLLSETRKSGTARRDMDGHLYKTTPEIFRDIFGVEHVSANLSPTAESDEIISCSAVKLSSGSSNAIYRNGKAFYVNGMQVLSDILELSNLKPTYYMSHNPWTMSPAVDQSSYKPDSFVTLNASKGIHKLIVTDIYKHL